MSTVNGLPAHILLVHAVVVLLPLTAVLLVLTAAWAPARARLAGPNALLAWFVVALVPVTTEAGEWLERRVSPSDLVRDHAELGDTALWVALPVAVLAAVVWWRSLDAGGAVATLTRGRTFLAPHSARVTTVVTVLAVLAAGAAAYDIYLIGDSGAQASWHDRVNQQPAPRRDGR